MIFFDYIYYIFCNLYKRSKSERETHMWKHSGSALAALSMALFFISITFFLSKVLDLSWSNVFTDLFFVLFFCIIFFIRYTVFTNYDSAKEKITQANNYIITFLNITVIVYFFIILSYLCCAMYIGYIKTVT